jgi:hypothetical protein
VESLSQGREVLTLMSGALYDLQFRPGGYTQVILKPPIPVATRMETRNLALS